MEFNQSKIKEFEAELSYLTDLNVCIYFDGSKCSKYNKECSGRIDDPTVIPPCSGKDYKSLPDKLLDKMGKEES